MFDLCFLSITPFPAYLNTLIDVSFTWIRSLFLFFMSFSTDREIECNISIGLCNFIFSILGFIVPYRFSQGQEFYLLYIPIF